MKQKLFFIFEEINFFLAVNLSHILAFILVLSGMTALTYEVLWSKKLELVFGTSSEAIVAVLSIFFAGLAAGSFLFGKLADRLSRHHLLYFYGIVEVCIGVLSAFSPIAFPLLDKLSLAYIFLPALLLGGTLPLVSKYCASFDNLKNKISLLYSLNTFGGIIGVIMTVLVLIQTLGVNNSIHLASLINLLLGGIVIFIARVIFISYPKSIYPTSGFKKEKFIPDKSFIHPQFADQVLLGIVFLTGLLALILEVLWTKSLVLVSGTSFYSLSIILVSFLSGIVLGSLVVRFIKQEQTLIWFGISQFLISCWILISLPLINKLPKLYISFFMASPDFYWRLWSIFFVSVLLIFPATFFSGLSLPLVVVLYKRNINRLGLRVGMVYGANTLGAIAGPLVAYFILLPQLGIQKSLILTGIAYFIIATLFLWRHLAVYIMLLTGTILLVYLNLQIFSWDKIEMSSGRYANRTGDFPGTKMLFYQEGKNALVTVKEADSGERFLQINGKTDASEIGDLESELLLGHLSLLFAHKPQKVLVIGFGSGITAGAVSTYPVSQIDIAEIEEAVIAASSYFSRSNHNILADDRVRLVKDDARSYLKNSNQSYDVITSQPSNIWVSGNANLFTREFYQLAYAHLADDGVMLQWLQLYDISNDNLKIAIKTFSQIFPHVYFWSGFRGNNLFMMGMKQPLDTASAKEYLSLPAIREDLARIGISSDDEIFDFYISSDDKIAPYLQAAEINSDDFPYLELRVGADRFLSVEYDNVDFFDGVLEKHPLQSTDSFTFRQFLIDIQKARIKDQSVLTLEFFEKILKIRPQNKEIKRLYANFLNSEASKKLNLKDYGLARNYIQKANSLLPDNFLILGNLGRLYIETEQLDKGIETLKRAIGLAPNYPDLYRLLGVSYGMKKDWNSAERELLSSANLDPKNILVLNELAEVYLQAGKSNEAIYTWRKSLSINQNQPEVQGKLMLLFKE